MSRAAMVKPVLAYLSRKGNGPATVSEATLRTGPRTAAGQGARGSVIDDASRGEDAATTAEAVTGLDAARTLARQIAQRRRETLATQNQTGGDAGRDAGGDGAGGVRGDAGAGGGAGGGGGAQEAQGDTTVTETADAPVNPAVLFARAIQSRRREQAQVGPIKALGLGIEQGGPQTVASTARAAQTAIAGVQQAPEIAAGFATRNSTAGRAVRTDLRTPIAQPTQANQDARQVRARVSDAAMRGEREDPRMSQAEAKAAQDMADAREQRSKSDALTRVRDWLGTVAQEFGATAQDMDARNQSRMTREGVGGAVTRFAYDAGKSAAPMVASVGATVAGGAVAGPGGALAAGFASSFVTEGGDTAQTVYEDLRAQNMSEEEALASAFYAAAPAGAAKAAIEQFGAERVFRGLLKPFAQRVGITSENVMRRAATQWATAALAEAGEEVAQGTVDRTVRTVTTGQGAQPVSWQALREMGREALLGGVMGGAMAGPGVAAGAVQATRDAKVADTQRQRDAAAPRGTASDGTASDSTASDGTTSASDNTKTTPADARNATSPRTNPGGTSAAAAPPDDAGAPRGGAGGSIAREQDVRAPEKAAEADSQEQRTENGENATGGQAGGASGQNGAEVDARIDEIVDELDALDTGKADDARRRELLNELARLRGEDVSGQDVNPGQQDGGASAAQRDTGATATEQTTAEQVAAMSVAELRAKAKTLGVNQRGAPGAVRRRVLAAMEKAQAQAEAANPDPRARDSESPAAPAADQTATVPVEQPRSNQAEEIPAAELAKEEESSADSTRTPKAADLGDVTARDVAAIAKATGKPTRVVEPTTDAQRRIAEGVAAMSGPDGGQGRGRRVVFVEDADGVDGAASVGAEGDGRTVYINAKLATDEEAAPILAHETLHLAVEQNPTLRAELAGMMPTEELAAAAAKYREKLVRSFTNDHPAVKRFDSDARVREEEAVATALQEAAAATPQGMKLARQLYETPGLLERIRQQIVKVLDAVGIKRMAPQTRAMMRLLDQVRSNAKQAQRDAAAWAQTREGTRQRVIDAARNTVAAQTRESVSDRVDRANQAEGRESRDIDLQGFSTSSMFSFEATTLPTEVKDWLGTLDPKMRRQASRLFRTGVRGATGADALAALRDDYFTAALESVDGTAANRTAAAAKDLREDPDPQSQLVAAVWQSEQNRQGDGKLPAKIGVPARALALGDVFRVNGQAVRVVDDEDGNVTLRGGPFTGIDPRGLDIVPVDAGTHFREKDRASLQLVAELMKEDLRERGGVGIGTTDAAVVNRAADVPFAVSGRRATTDERARGRDIPRKATASQRPTLTRQERSELYPGIRAAETIEAYEKRMGTADTPLMFAPSTIDAKTRAKVGTQGIEQRAQKESDAAIAKLEADKAAAASEKATAKATIGTLRTLLRAATKRNGSLTKTVQILDAMAQRQAGRADANAEEASARAQAMAAMNQSQRDRERVREELVRLVTKLVPAERQGQFLQDVRDIKNTGELYDMTGRIMEETTNGQARELASKMRRLTGLSDMQRIGDTKYVDRAMKTGRLSVVSGLTVDRTGELTDAAPDSPKQRMRDAIAKFAAAGARFDAATGAAARANELIAMESAYLDMATIVHAARLEKQATQKRRRRGALSVARAIIDELDSTRTKTVMRRLGKLGGSAIRRGMMALGDIQTFATMVDGRSQGGPFDSNIVKPIERAERAYMTLRTAMAEKADLIARQAGFDSLAEAQVKLGGALGEAAATQYTLAKAIDLPGMKGITKIPAPVALDLYATDPATMVGVLAGRPLHVGEALEEGQGFTLSPEVYQTIIDAIPLEHRVMVDAMKADANSYFPLMKRVVYALTGRDLEGVDQQHPRTVNPKWKARVLDAEKAGAEAMSPDGMVGHVAASLENLGLAKNRTSETAPLVISSFFAKHESKLDEMARIIHLAEPIRDAKMTLQVGELGSALAQKVHPQAMARVMVWLNDVAGVAPAGKQPGRVARAIVQAGRNVAQALTALNINSWLRNLGGLAMLKAAMPARVWARGFAGMFGTQWSEIVASSAYIKHTYGGGYYNLAGGAQTEIGKGAGGGGTVNTAGTTWQAFTRAAGAMMRTLASGAKEAGRAGKNAAKLDADGVRAALANLARDTTDLLIVQPGAAFDGVRIMQWWAGLSARVAYAGWHAEAKARGLDAEAGKRWAIEQTERTLRATQGQNNPMTRSEVQTRAMGTPWQPFWMFTSDAFRGFNLLAQAVVTGQAEYREARKQGAGVLAATASMKEARKMVYNVLGALAVNGVLGGAISAFVKPWEWLLGYEQEERDQENAWHRFWTVSLRDSLGSIAPGVVDRLVEVFGLMTAPNRTGQTLGETALGNPAASMLGDVFDGVDQFSNGLSEAMEGDDGKGNTAGQNITAGLMKFVGGYGTLVRVPGMQQVRGIKRAWDKSSEQGTNRVENWLQSIGG